MFLYNDIGPMGYSQNLNVYPSYLILIQGGVNLKAI